MAAFHMDDFHAFDRDERQSLHSWLVAEGLSTGLLISCRTVILPRLLLLESYKVAPDGGCVYQHYRPVTRHRLHWARSRPPPRGVHRLLSPPVGRCHPRLAVALPPAGMVASRCAGDASWLPRARGGSRGQEERVSHTLFGQPLSDDDIQRIPGLAEALQRGDQDAVTEALDMAARDGNPVIAEYLARHEARERSQHEAAVREIGVYMVTPHEGAVFDPHPDRCWRCDATAGLDDLEGLCEPCHTSLTTSA